MKRLCQFPATKAICGVCCVLVFLSLASRARAQTDALREGIRQYRAENYEEAVKILEKARKEAPQSEAAAFFLGLAYKQTLNLAGAAEQLRFAVSGKTRIREALVELIDVLQRIGTPASLKEAMGWVAVGEQAKIDPAKIAFLKGLVLKKQGKIDEADAAFERAKALDPLYAQPADFQVAMGYLKQRDFSKARDRLRRAIVADPQSDLATFARQYQASVEEAIKNELQVTVGLFAQYNTNVIDQPSTPAYQIPNKDIKSPAFAPSLRLVYAPILREPWLFSAQYTGTATFNQKNGTQQDYIANSLTLTPGFSFGTHSVGMNVSYTHMEKKDPSYTQYSDELDVGPLWRTVVGGQHLIELYAGYQRKTFFAPALLDEDDRDSRGLNAYVSWIWTFHQDAFFNLKCEYVYEDTDGVWWRNNGYRISANLAYPILENVQIQLGGLAYWQRYTEDNILLGNTNKRDDKTYQINAGFTWMMAKHLNGVFQFIHTAVDSNIGYYNYNQNLFTAGVEYRF